MSMASLFIERLENRSMLAKLSLGGQMERRMPLARYFFYVGGVVLALLFMADGYLPKLPVAYRADKVSYNIRIHSDRKWPERIVYDTSLPAVTAPQIASTEQSAAAPSPIASSKPREQEAFAQLPPSDANQLQSSDSKKPEPKRQRQRKITNRHTPPPALLMARQRQFGWFAYW
jgi:hypothetical protein